MSAANMGTSVLQMSLEAGERLLQIILSVDPYIVSDNTSSLLPCDASHVTEQLRENAGGSHPATRLKAGYANARHRTEGLSVRSGGTDRGSDNADLQATRRWGAHAAQARLSTTAQGHQNILSGPGAETSQTKFTLQTDVGPADVIAKPARLHQDIWDSLVAPSIGCSALRVESWLHGWNKLPDRCQATSCVVNAAGVKLDMPLKATFTAFPTVSWRAESDAAAEPVGMQWDIYQDHAKWAVCCNTAAVCFGDMNRMQSQRKRGGLAICYRPSDMGRTQFAVQLHRRLIAWLVPDAQACCARAQPAI